MDLSLFVGSGYRVPTGRTRRLSCGIRRDRLVCLRRPDGYKEKINGGKDGGLEDAMKAVKAGGGGGDGEVKRRDRRTTWRTKEPLDRFAAARVDCREGLRVLKTYVRVGEIDTAFELFKEMQVSFFWMCCSFLNH